VVTEQGALQTVTVVAVALTLVVELVDMLTKHPTVTVRAVLELL
jgi:hypothetical protein